MLRLVKFYIFYFLFNREGKILFHVFFKYSFQNDCVHRNLKVLLNYLDPPKDDTLRYIIKFSTDGAKLTNNKTGVQGTIKLMDVDTDGHPTLPTRLPERFHREICVFYFIGL